MVTIEPAAPLPPRPRVRASYCRHLVALLGEEGVPPSAVLAGTGLLAADLEGSEARLHYDQQLRIYRNAHAHSRDPALGFRLGQRQRTSDHGVFGYAIQSSSDLEQAVRIILRYLSTTGPLVALGFERDEDVAVVTLHELVPLGELGRMAREEALVVLQRNLLGLTEPTTSPLEIRVDLPAARPELYERELGCPVHFGCTRCELRFDAAHLSRPLAFADAETARVCEQRCAEVLERLGAPGGIVEQVRRQLITAPGRRRSLEQVARALGMSGRTLRRRLAAAHTHFQAIDEEVRRALALDYLERSNLSVDEIAGLVGYTETPNFYRAFKRWTGRPPGAYRGRDHAGVAEAGRP